MYNVLCAQIIQNDSFKIKHTHFPKMINICFTEFKLLKFLNESIHFKFHISKEINFQKIPTHKN